jgi:hypothetical protein
MTVGLCPRLQHKQPVTIGAFHPTRFAQIKKYPRMAQGPAIPITGYAMLVGFNRLWRLNGHGPFSSKTIGH